MKDQELREDDSRLIFEEQTAKPSDIEIAHIQSEEEDYESSPPDYLINTYPADFTLEVLNVKWKKGDIKIPKFQRQFVWRQVQSSKLIESFLVGLPVPAIFLYTERKSQQYFVIDGQQRLKSIFYFLEGYFDEAVSGKRKVFRLEGLSVKSRYFNKTFSELEEPDQRRLNNCVLRSFIVQQLEPDDETSIYHVFERLNTGGTLLTNQEVRNCVYRGKLNEQLLEMNKYLGWRKILGKPEPDSRQKDIELMVRFLSLRDLSHYEKPMKEVLSKFMKKNINPNSEYLLSVRTMFEKTCDSILKSLGEKPFHLTRGLNAAVFDSVMVAFSKNEGEMPPNIKDRYTALLLNTDYIKSITDHTTDDDNVKKRFGLAEQILFRG